MEKGAILVQSYFLHKLLKQFGRKVSDALTKDMDQIY